MLNLLEEVIDATEWICGVTTRIRFDQRKKRSNCYKRWDVSQKDLSPAKVSVLNHTGAPVTPVCRKPVLWRLDSCFQSCEPVSSDLMVSFSLFPDPDKMATLVKSGFHVQFFLCVLFF